jgi:hypothetical protein
VLLAKRLEALSCSRRTRRIVRVTIRSTLVPLAPGGTGDVLALTTLVIADELQQPRQSQSTRPSSAQESAELSSPQVTRRQGLKHVSGGGEAGDAEGGSGEGGGGAGLGAGEGGGGGGGCMMQQAWHCTQLRRSSSRHEKDARRTPHVSRRHVRSQRPTAAGTSAALEVMAVEPRMLASMTREGDGHDGGETHKVHLQQRCNGCLFSRDNIWK